MSAIVLSLIVIVVMMKRKCFQRPKVNCLCRCTPATGIEILHHQQLESVVQDAYSRISATRSTSVIASQAVRVGGILEQTGHLVPAMTMYDTAIRCIFRMDSSRAEDYYYFGPLPPNPYYRSWYERMNDADALEVAARLDPLYKRLKMPGYAHQQRFVRVYYEGLFRSVYSACM